MNLFNNINWEKYSIPTSAAYGSISIYIGKLGETPPTATIISGVHGDEGPWGALAIKKALEKIEHDDLVGSMKIIPVANPTAMEADSRVSPIDNLDLNRVFPGNHEGTHTQRIAGIITKYALEGSDYVFDIHGGGSWCVNSFAFSFKGSEDLVKAINPSFIVKATEKPGSLSSYAIARGLKVTAIEMGGRSRNENNWISKLADGLRRGLRQAGVIESKILEKPTTNPMHVGPTKVLRSIKGGIFIPKVNEDTVGTILKKDIVLGTLINPVTMDQEQIFKTPFKKTAVLLLRPRISVVEGGAMIYVLAPLSKGNKN
jgi:predicted deacylase